MKMTFLEAARPEGLEPSTYGLEIRCSIRLSYGRRLRGQYVVLELEKSSGNAEITKVKRTVRGDQLNAISYATPYSRVYDAV